MNNIAEFDNNGFEIDNSIDLIDGARSSTGKEYLCFTQGRNQAWIDRDLFSPDPTAGVLALKRAGIKTFTAAQRNEISTMVAARTHFRPLEIIERIGWNGLKVGYPNGTVFPLGVDTPPIAYPVGAVRVESRGSWEQWSEQVAAFVGMQHLLLFCIMIAFAAPLLALTRIQGNFAFMLSGPPRKGKTTCIDVAASVCGPALDSSGGRYYLKFNNTMNRIEQLLPYYADLPLIIDELSSHGTRSSRTTDFRTLVHHLAGVDARGRFGDELAPAAQTRTIILITSNDGLAELLSLETPDAADAVSDRMIEIPVPRGDEGVFNAPHPEHVDAHAFAEAVRDRVGLNYGTAMPEFLQRLTEDLSADQEALVGGINRRMTKFAALPAVREAGAVSSRIIDAFGLVYAAGSLAKYYGILPRSVNCQAAALHCLRLHLGLRAEADPVQRLLAWISANKVIDLRGGELPRLSDARLKRRGAFVGECRGVAQFWMVPSMFEASFDNPRLLLRRLAAKQMLKLEGAKKRNTVKCAIRAGKEAERVHVFAIPDLEDWLEANGYSRPKRRRR